MSGKMTRPGGETSESPTRTFGGPANANTSRQADAQPIARVAKVSAAKPTASKPSTAASSPYAPPSRDYGGDGVPMGGSYSNPSSSPLLGKP
jgi:hypothetical protein